MDIINCYIISKPGESPLFDDKLCGYAIIPKELFWEIGGPDHPAVKREIELRQPKMSAEVLAARRRDDDERDRLRALGVVFRDDLPQEG
jgi:hypothetical protein